MHGGNIAPFQDDITPVIELDDFQGNISFITSNIGLTGGAPGELAPIVIKGDGTGSNLMFLCSSFHEQGNPFVNESPNATVAFLESYLHDSTGGTIRRPNEGRTDTEFVKEMLTHTRNEHHRPLTVMDQQGVSDVQMHRVTIDKMKTGLHMSCDKMDIQSAEYAELGIFEETVDWGRQGNYKMSGRLDVEYNNGNLVYTVGGNGDGCAYPQSSTTERRV